jgi:hypothetical protein
VGVRNLFAGTWNVEVVVLACTFEVFFFLKILSRIHGLSNISRKLSISDMVLPDQLKEFSWSKTICAYTCSYVTRKEQTKMFIRLSGLYI